MERLLLVEDDQDIAAAIAMALTDEGWAVDHAVDGRAGLARGRSGEYDLILLDVRLPGMSGFEVCRELRRFTRVPILFLTARGDEVDRVIGLELGGDDYLVKPVGIRELKARVRALLRRAQAPPEAEQRIRTGDLVILPARRAIHRGEERIRLTNSEMALLLALVRRPDAVITRESLMNALYDAELNTGSLLTVNVHIRNLRERLGDDPEHPRYIATVRGVGYRWIGNRT